MDTEILVDKIIEQTPSDVQQHSDNDNDNGYVDVQDLMRNINRTEALAENKVIVAEPDSSTMVEPLEATLAEEINKIKSQVKKADVSGGVVTDKPSSPVTTSKCSWLQGCSTSSSLCETCMS